MTVEPRKHPSQSSFLPRIGRRLICFAFTLAACSDDDITGPPQPVAASLDLADAPATLLVADTIRLTVTATDSTGAPITPSVTWSSDDGTVATVNQSGLVSGNAEGTTMIRVTAGLVSDSVSLTVTQGMRFVSLVTGMNHTCGLSSTGEVSCWGANWGWQLGVETTSHTCPAGPEAIDCSPRPVAVASPIPLVTLTAGGSHTCGLDGSGRAWCWGDNAWEVLGHRWDVTSRSAEPVAVSGGQVFQTLNAGGDFNCGLTQTGAAYCWGSHGLGELGTGDLELFTSPEPVAVIGGRQYAQLSSGWAHTCAWTGGGIAYCWGETLTGSLGIGSVTPPEEWPAEPTPTAVVGGLTFSEVEAGSGWSCGLTTAGAAYCWGTSIGGQLGNGSTESKLSPSPVSGGLTWRSLSAGWGHICGVTTAGVIACWGNNAGGQLGVAPTQQCPGTDGQPPFGCSTTPVPLPTTPRNFKTVVPGGDFTCALDDLGYAFCWGFNNNAQLGNGRVGGSSHIPSPVVRPQ